MIKLTKDGVAFSFHNVVRIEIEPLHKSSHRQNRNKPYKYKDSTTRKICLVDKDGKSMEITCFGVEGNPIPVEYTPVDSLGQRLEDEIEVIDI